MERAVPWARMAVALRPDNALGHYQLAMAFDMGSEVYYLAEQNPAVDELERTIQLAPNLARAHSKLAMLLLNRTKDGRQQDTVALALAELALALDDKDSHAHAVMFAYYLGKKDYARAALATKEIKGNTSDVHYGYDASYEQGMISVAGSLLVEGLSKMGMPYEAYQFVSLWGHGGKVSDMNSKADELNNVVKAAVLAGTGQGTDPPPDADRAKVRRRAFEWMTKNLDRWRSETNREGFDSTIALAQKVTINAAMKLWLTDPDLARVRIADGDTITILTADKKQVKIRFNGIDALERGQPFGTNSEQFVSGLIGEKSVRVVTHGEERYGRMIGDIYARPETQVGSNPEVHFNFMMIANGYAWHYVRYAPDNKELADAEKHARDKKLGLWADTSPIAQRRLPIIHNHACELCPRDHKSVPRLICAPDTE